ncbi:pyruvate, phosphate dikinase [Latilactobacillus fuchuensis]|uniref:Pyruvate, phosphate dikinase n=1 Tax=Latilactobacillus fuchuensis DSM 14340 = JCM 11249 TaxID=1423747 RepID=A0A0R1RSM8_9LACO|nr:pyruvate, phosphate dikinase [Latilactobacillus fuchuensis]KRL59406.1 ppdK protein [Latilactobacillus fuchuensis DSM 14340 = JCM 11249]
MQYIYAFAEDQTLTNTELGGKGANLAEMTRLGLPVPAGFTITTAACQRYLTNGQAECDFLKDDLMKAVQQLEATTHRQLGNPEQPLLVSVRSGAPISMPGMMDTVLNLGLNDQTVEGLAKQTHNPWFAYDCYRRLIQMFGDVVYGIDKSIFEAELTALKRAKQVTSDTDLTLADLKQLIQTYQTLYQNTDDAQFPQSVTAQLTLAVEAVFKSWLNPRAKTYRRLHEIDATMGTAVNIQQMVFGNYQGQSGTGVAFTRNPATGEPGLFGEYLLNAQGEDVVAGIRTPEPIATLKAQLPTIYEQFKTLANQLERHYQDMQDMEFTIEAGQLYVLQTRIGKRTPQAAFKIALDLVNEGLINRQTAILRLKPAMIEGLLHPVFDPQALKQAPLLLTGLPASPGAATGAIYFDAQQAQVAHEAGEKVILVRQETSPEDIDGMVVSQAIVTSRGGMTSHAAVVARGMGCCCVVGCAQLSVDTDQKQADFNGQLLKEGAIISVDGHTGRIYLGALGQQTGKQQAALNTILDWCDAEAPIDVWANAETPKEVATAFEFGAKGLGLVRTEHMFFGPERLFKMREMILADQLSDRQIALAALKELQLADFKAIFELAQDRPCTIRLLDPPLHEFLPQATADQVALATALQISPAEIKRRIAAKIEVNPMLGHRGSRLAVTYPEIYQMQVLAIIESALAVQVEQGHAVAPKIMLPLIGTAAEMQLLKQQLTATIDTFLAQQAQTIAYQIGTMIEVPRACLVADQIADSADFFSFGTNDLTQMTFGFSRDDIGHFIGAYQEQAILSSDPFQTLDQDGVGALMRIAIQKGRQTKPELSIGVCGEVGGDPSSIAFCQALGVDYVSCSPYRVPSARLAAAQVALQTRV